jgi:AraC-like DNA-binding protein
MDKKSELISRLKQILSSEGIKFVHLAEQGGVMPRGANFSSCDRLAVPLSGCHRMDIFSSGKVTRIHPKRHEATFMPTGIWNKPDWILPVDVVTFGFQRDLLWSSFVKCEGGGLNSTRDAIRIVTPPLSPSGEKTLELVKEAYSGDQTKRGRLLLETLLYYCLDSLEAANTSESKAHHTWRSVCAYLEDNFASEITREETAILFKLAPNYLSFLFKQQSGYSFVEYLNNMRLKKACFLLKNFNQTLDEIAFNTGFRSTAYFCRIFKKTFNQTPTQYRTGK